MKAFLFILATLLALVPFALSLRDFPSASVLDMEGKAVEVGSSYYAVSAVNFQAGGLCLVDLKNKTLACPHDVVQCPKLEKPNLGFPIMFQSGLNMTVESVKEGSPYNIRFPVTAVGVLCIKDVFWGLEDDNMLRKFVTTDPAATAEFTVQRDGFGYRIAYCVYIPVPRIPVCYAVGFITDGANSRLGIGLGVNPIQFFFSKFNGTALHNHATS